MITYLDWPGSVASIPPSYSSVGTSTSSSAANTTSPLLPGGVTSTMAMVAYVLCWDSTTHTTATSGWTKVTQVNNGGSQSMSLWIAQGGAGAPTFTVSGVGAACYAIIASYANANGSSYGAVSTNSGSGTTHTTTALTSTQDNSLIILADAVRAAGSFTTPSGWTQDGNFTSIQTGALAFYNKTLATSGSSSGAVSITGPSGSWDQVQFELKHF